MAEFAEGESVEGAEEYYHFPEPAVEILIVIDPAPFRVGAGSDVNGCGTTRSTG
jgi:hypothetical protein